MLTNAKKSWQTSLLGLLMLGIVGLQVSIDPAKATSNSEMLIGQIIIGLGLILAKDAGVTHSARE